MTTEPWTPEKIRRANELVRGITADEHNLKRLAKADMIQDYVGIVMDARLSPPVKEVMRLALDSLLAARVIAARQLLEEMGVDPHGAWPEQG